MNNLFYHLKIACRNLRQNGMYSAINIGGLAIGIAASVFIFLWVYNERSFDRHYPDVERIYRITQGWEGSPYPLGEAVKNELPEVEYVAIKSNLKYIRSIKIHEEVIPVDDAVYVTGEWFNVFPYELSDGSFAPFSRNPFSVVLTASAAKKLFGIERAVGQQVNINDADYTVQAVIKDHPANTSYRFGVMVPMDALFKDPARLAASKKWNQTSSISFVKLRQDTDAAAVTQKINDILKKNIDVEITLQPLTDIHFEPVVLFSSIEHGNIAMVNVFTALAVLLLITACANYVNLTTARTSIRNREIGVKKIIGAKRKTLFLQIFTESAIIGVTAAATALILIILLSPLYHLMVDNAALHFDSPVIWIILGSVLSAATFLNGIYPALILSSFRPINLLKGMSLPGMKDRNLRRGLVIFQFTLSAALIIGVMIIHSQMRFIRTTNPGYEREQIITFDTPYRSLSAQGEEKAASILQSIKGELQARPDFAGVALCGQPIARIRFTTVGADWDGRPENFNPSINVLSADADYMQVLGLKLSEGRWFVQNNTADLNNFLLNETAVRELGIREPYTGQRFKLMGKEGKIIGVVKDFHFKSMHEKIEPLVVVNFPSFNTDVTCRTQPGKSDQAIRAAKEVYAEFFPNDPFGYTFMDDTFNSLHQADIKTSRLMSAFSIIAVFIAILGLFGLSAFAVERRTKEIGIRKVLGASVSIIVNMLTREFLILVAIAFVIAIPLSWWAMSKWLDNFAYRVDLTVWFFVAGGIVTLFIALVTVGFQAVKAATANPVKSLKTE